MLKLHAILVIALASSACADTPHGGTTDGSSTPLGSAPENHTHSLPGAASTMRLSAKNRVVPAYPRVRLSPATLEMLASAPSVMKPRAEAAAHLLSPEHASDTSASPLSRRCRHSLRLLWRTVSALLSGRFRLVVRH